MRRRAGLAENGETDGTLLLRLVTADGLPPRGSHAVSRIALVIADGRRLEVRLGEPMDNDETQDAYLMTDPKYMLWSPTKIVDGRTARCVENTGGVYTHAPICFRVTPDSIAASAAIEIEHAPDEAADDLALEIYNSRDYRRLGVLRARHSVGGWHVDTLPISLGVGCQENARTSPADRSAAATPEPAESDLGSQRRVLSVPHRGADPLPLDSPQSDGTGREKWESDEARFLDVSLCNHVTLAPQHLFGLGETISFRIIAELRTEVPVCWFAAIIYDDRGNRILLAVHKVNSRAERGQHEILLHLRNPNLRQGNYVVTLELLPEFDYNWHGPVRMPYLCHWDRCVFFSIDEGYHGSIDLGLVSLPGDFTIRRCTPHDNGDGTSSMAQLAK